MFCATAACLKRLRVGPFFWANIRWLLQTLPKKAKRATRLPKSPHGMNVLAAAGVIEQIRNVSVISSEWAFENHHGKLLASRAEIVEW
jgi:hypothetical protein